MNKPHCCPALALSAHAVHGTQDQVVLSPREPVWEQIRYFVYVWKPGNFHSWTSSPVPVALSQKLPVTVQFLRIVFQLGSLFPVGSYYLFVFTEAMPFLPAAWNLMCYYPKLFFSFNFRNIIVWFVWTLLLPFTVATVCWNLHCIMTSHFSH